MDPPPPTYQTNPPISHSRTGHSTTRSEAGARSHRSSSRHGSRRHGHGGSQSQSSRRSHHSRAGSCSGSRNRGSTELTAESLRALNANNPPSQSGRSASARSSYTYANKKQPGLIRALKACFGKKDTDHDGDNESQARTVRTTRTGTTSRSGRTGTVATTNASIYRGSRKWNFNIKYLWKRHRCLTIGLGSAVLIAIVMAIVVGAVLSQRAKTERARVVIMTGSHNQYPN